MRQDQYGSATKAIGMMLQGFPNVQSGITAETVAAYLTAVEDIDLEPVQMACRAFSKGLIAKFNYDFAPTAPRLASEARKFEQALNTLAEVRSAPKLVSYPIGGTPPEGFVAVGFTEDHVEGFTSIPRITVGDPEGNADAGEAA